ncbi:hypothetical protein ACFQ05_26715 [Amycolatopsis umgeniensis]|uniref:Uncharacterized protein n=1 Tax=Amycolatopsis umgeniensis TaxID=336628 RepID=A0A841BC49_9PSEU|nr:hypothetical protein [Amycolatopsis umgeniensis]MBB5856481.1 hypothetical protein [Amycolatopsis umgeniensis]
MARNTFARLLAALADATPAFTPPSAPDAPGRGRRLLTALADATPSFHPGGPPPGVANRAAAAAPEGTADCPGSENDADLGPTDLEQVVQRLIERTPRERLESRISVPIEWMRLIRAWARLLIMSEKLTGVLDDLVPRVRVQDLTVRRVEALAADLSNGIIDEFRDASVDVSAFLKPVGYPDNARKLFTAQVTTLRSMLSEVSRKQSRERVDDEVAAAHELAIEIVRVLTHLLGELLSPPEPPVDRPRGSEDARAIAHGFKAYAPRRATPPAGSHYGPGIIVDRRYSPGRLITVLDRLETAVTDFTDADLAEADLRGLRLRGVQWSMLTTQWPPGWADLIRAISVPIAPDKRPDLYEIRNDPEMLARQTFE